MKGKFVAAAIFFAAIVPAAVAETPSEQQACVKDAFRVCLSAMPDRHNVFVCLAKNSSQLSGACREVIARYSPHSRPAQRTSDLHSQDHHSNGNQDPYNSVK
jgi:hypothetical protein